MEDLLIKLGFKITHDVFTGNNMLTLGEEEVDLFGVKTKLPIIYYNIETQICSFNQDEFSIIRRECKTEEDIRKFVECINFLRNYSLKLN